MPRPPVLHTLFRSGMPRRVLFSIALLLVPACLAIGLGGRTLSYYDDGTGRVRDKRFIFGRLVSVGERERPLAREFESLGIAESLGREMLIRDTNWLLPSPRINSVGGRILTTHRMILETLSVYEVAPERRRAIWAEVRRRTVERDADCVDLVEQIQLDADRPKASSK